MCQSSKSPTFTMKWEWIHFFNADSCLETLSVYGSFKCISFQPFCINYKEAKMVTRNVIWWSWTTSRPERKNFLSKLEQKQILIHFPLSLIFLWSTHSAPETSLKSLKKWMCTQLFRNWYVRIFVSLASNWLRWRVKILVASKDFYR